MRFESSSSSDHTRPVISVEAQLRHRMAEGYRVAVEWISRITEQISGHHLTIKRKPANPQEAKDMLLTERAAWEPIRSAGLAEAQACGKDIEATKAERDRLTKAIAEEKDRIDREKQEIADLKARALASAIEGVALCQQVLAQRTQEHQAAKADADRAIARSDALGADPRPEKPVSDAGMARRVKNLTAKGSETVPDAIWEAEAPRRAEKRKERLNACTRLLVDESTYPIPWAPEPPTLLGQRTLPKGAFPSEIRVQAPHAAVVGASGKWANVDFTGKNAWREIADLAVTDTPRSKKAGQPVKHVAHGVLSKPLDESGGIQKWRPDEAARAGRHYLRSQGADPDRHDYIVVVHSDKHEEAIHVLWNRVRDDGKIHSCENAWVAAALGRARWDQHAGIDPARISVADLKEKPVREGFKKIRDDSLCAVYKSVNGKDVEVVPLIGKVHAENLAKEGLPDSGRTGGTWTPKPCYRKTEEIRQIMFHCLCEGK